MQKRRGDHHTALCNPNYSNKVAGNSKITCLIKNNTSMLLETPNVLISGKNVINIVVQNRQILDHNKHL